ncbi:carbamoyl phosphate synthase small subunit [bacterium]|nr:MAG: carbamoyl phosphate synthase small subunit [bacterium]
MSAPAFLALADGTVWPGRALGAQGQRTGEVVFNTCMTGYQEVLTDPSYCRQIVVMTAPHIGNTGVNAEDDESTRAWAAGFAVRRASLSVSSWRATGTLDDYLRAHGVIGISDIDTRALVRHLRAHGAMHGALVSGPDADPEIAVGFAETAPDINALDLVGEVSCRAPYVWSEPVAPEWYPLDAPAAGDGGPHDAGPADEARGRASLDSVVRGVRSWLRGPEAGRRYRPHVVVFDFGVKHNTLRLLAARGCRVTVVPARTPANVVTAVEPDGVLLSNGPGDPDRLGDIVETVRALLGHVPIFGICLGHQVLGAALGGHSYKLKFGHRGGNQPVLDRRTNQVAISSHNHGFALADEGFGPEVEITHVNLNDGCVEGLAAPAVRAFSVQYHPEAAPGPHDAADLFDAFLHALRDAREKATKA